MLSWLSFGSRGIREGVVGAIHDRILAEHGCHDGGEDDVAGFLLSGFKIPSTVRDDGMSCSIARWEGRFVGCCQLARVVRSAALPAALLLWSPAGGAWLTKRVENWSRNARARSPDQEATTLAGTRRNNVPRLSQLAAEAPDNPRFNSTSKLVPFVLDPGASDALSCCG